MMLMQHLVHPIPMMQELDEEDDQSLPSPPSTSTTTATSNGFNGIRIHKIKELLQSKMTFIPASSTSTVQSIPYPAINDPPPPIKSIIQKPVTTTILTPTAPPTPPTSTSSKSPAPVASTSSITTRSPALFPAIDPGLGWPKPVQVGKGLQNEGNTCFLNSALQVLMHTAALVRNLTRQTHDTVNCAMRKKTQFCMSCAMIVCLELTFDGSKRGPFRPKPVSGNLKKIAQHMRHGRQEDAHEFLRFCIDGMQLSCLAGKSPKLDIKIKESTWVHQVFGGRLRSRVTCVKCNHPSDTFDSILDLSLDVQRSHSITEALDKFVKIDDLKGANKYKCEKCQKLVEAKKNFTIDVAPPVLTIHLKRFTSSGKKIAEMIKYPEVLQLGNYMSDRSLNPTYRLFGVIHHSGGGPHSGHYTADVRASNGKWYHMDDENVTGRSGVPSNAKTAYVLFYCRDKGDALNAAVFGGATNGNGNGVAMTNGNGKRPRESDVGERAYSSSPAQKKQYIEPPVSGPRPPMVLTASTNGRSAYSPPLSVVQHQSNHRPQNNNGGYNRNATNSPYRPGGNEFSSNNGPALPYTGGYPNQNKGRGNGNGNGRGGGGNNRGGRGGYHQRGTPMPINIVGRMKARKG